MNVPIYIDLDTLKLVAGRKVKRALSMLSVKRGDDVNFQLRFLRNGTPERIGDDATLVFAAKENEIYDGALRAFKDDFEPSAVESPDADPHWTGSVDFNSVQLGELFDIDGNENDPEWVDLMAEFSWQPSGEAGPTSSFTFVVRVYNDVYNDEDALPVSHLTPIQWLMGYTAPVNGVAASATIASAGGNNDIVVTAVDEGVGGNDFTIQLAIDATTDRTQLTVAEVAGDVVVTSGDKRRMIVAANFGAGVENYSLTYAGIAFDCYQWNNLGTINPIGEGAVRLEHAIDGSASYLLKIIDAFGGDSKFTVINPFVGWPDEVDWITAATDDGATGTPTVTDSPATAGQAVFEISITSGLSVSAAHAAANDGTGAIAAVAATPLAGGVDATVSPPYFRTFGGLLYLKDEDGIWVSAPLSAI